MLDYQASVLVRHFPHEKVSDVTSAVGEALNIEQSYYHTPSQLESIRLKESTRQLPTSSVGRPGAR